MLEISVCLTENVCYSNNWDECVLSVVCTSTQIEGQGVTLALDSLVYNF